MANEFGGSWTERKMEIVVSYAKAYLTIMQAQAWAKTVYFDGFAGSGSIVEEQAEGQVDFLKFLNAEQTSDAKKGTALRILDITDPKSFDIYYFVEKKEAFKKELDRQIKLNYPGRKAYVVKADCNNKLVDLANYLKENKAYRALAFIDPYGMSVKWSSIEVLKGLGIDLWILVPTGVSLNRVLVKNGEIPESWLYSLESFLGIERSEIKKRFYREVKYFDLFAGDEVTITMKENDVVHQLGLLYAEKLKQVFKYVSDAFVMRNSTNSIMYHFMMATNNPSALKIANDVIKPKYKL